MDRAHRRRPAGSEQSRRYAVGAAVYDACSFERLIYGRGRRLAVAQLRLGPGDRVLDVGCGTGLSFALLADAVGPSGTIVGLDASNAMLARAKRKVMRHGWTNVHLVHADAGSSDLARVVDDGRGAIDGILFAYSLSVMQNGSAAWKSALRATRPDGRIALVDLSLPTGRWSILRPLARLACLAGGANPSCKPWRLVTGDTADAVHHTLRGGHVQVAAGTVSGPDPGPAT